MQIEFNNDTINSINKIHLNGDNKMKKLLLILSFMTPFIVNALSIRELLNNRHILGFQSFHGDGKYSLDFSNKNITSLDGLQDLPNKENIISLSFAFNKIININEYSFNDFVNLEYLYFYNNKIVDISNAFNNLSKLKKINLNYNKISTLVNSFYNLTDLEEISLNHNEIKSINNAFDDSLTALKKINLASNRITNIGGSFNLLFTINPDIDLDINNNYLSQEDIDSLNEMQEGNNYDITNQNPVDDYEWEIPFNLPPYLQFED